MKMASGSSSRINFEEGGASLRKGPWTAEEDEILLEYVRRHGPRDWSSIRFKGLLPRTGKSCRLRWVNKLKPDLKRCKFSQEEESIVINLQAQLGNKWARIATFLPGRTDNDVKNFWSTRQKRLARILRTYLPKANKHDHGKLPTASQDAASRSEDPCLGPIMAEEITFQQAQYSGTTPFYMEENSVRELAQFPNLGICPCMLNLNDPLQCLHMLEPAALMGTEPCMINKIDPVLPQQAFAGYFPEQLGLPVKLEAPGLLTDDGAGVGFSAERAFPEPLQYIQDSGELTFFGLEDGILHGIRRGSDDPAMTNTFFDDCTLDVFDYIGTAIAGAAEFVRLILLVVMLVSCVCACVVFW